jgi:hypothetical protein
MGLVNVMIGYALHRLAEFVVLKIQQCTSAAAAQ